MAVSTLMSAQKGLGEMVFFYSTPSVRPRDRARALRGGRAACFAIVAIAALALASGAARADSRVAVGVQTNVEDNLNYASDLKADWLRIYFPWEKIERERGEYTFSRDLRRKIFEARERGFKITALIFGGNRLYEDGDTPFTDGGRRAYANFAAAIVDYFGEDIDAIEVGNEFNGSFVWGPARKNRIEAYSRLLSTAHGAVKTVRQEVRVIGGAAHSVPLKWFRRLFERGALDHMDAVAVHPFRDDPETLDIDLKALKALIAEFGGRQPIVATTFNPPAAHAGALPDYMLKTFTAMAGERVPSLAWKPLQSNKETPGMALVSKEGADTPAGRAFRFITERIAPLGFPTRIGSDRGVRAYRFGSGAETLHVVWGAPAPLRVDGGARYYSAVGAEIDAPGAVSERPVVIAGARSIEIGSANVLADSLLHFGGAPWSYHRIDHDGGERDMRRVEWDFDSFIGVYPTPLPAVKPGSVVPDGAPGSRHAVIERYNNNYTGVARIYGVWTAEPENSALDVRIYIDDEEIYRGRAAPELVLEGLELDLLRGDRLSFSVSRTDDETAETRARTARRSIRIERLD